MKRDIKLLLANLKNKFKYSLDGAVQVSLYVLDQNLAKRF